MAGLRTPLSTLHVRPHDRTRMTRGRCGSLLLHRNGLAPSALCRSPGAPDSGPAREDDLDRKIRLAAVRPASKRPADFDRFEALECGSISPLPCPKCHL